METEQECNRKRNQLYTELPNTKSYRNTDITKVQSFRTCVVCRDGCLLDTAV